MMRGRRGSRLDVRLRVALLAIVLNAGLVAVKFVLARMSGSASVQADAFHSLSDVLVSVLVFVGVGLGRRKRREGVANWAGVEHVVAIVVGIFILYAAFGIFRKAISSAPQPLAQVPVALVGVFICVLVSYYISRLEIRSGKVYDSPALAADGYHSLMNMYTSIGVMVSLVGVKIGLNLDSAAAAVIALLIAVTGVEIVVGSVRGLRRGRPIDEFAVYEFFQRISHRRGAAGAPSEDREPRIQAVLPRRRIVVLSILILLLAYLTTATSVAGPGQRLLVFRFGRAIGVERGPGLRFHLPWPVDEGRLVDMGRVRRAEIGFRTDSTEFSVMDRSYQWESRHTGGGYVKRLEESILLTGDINLIDINSVVLYRVANATRFLLASEDPDLLVRVAAESALRQVVGEEHIDGILTTDRRVTEEKCRDVIQSVLDPYDAGLRVISVRLQDVHPPLEVVASFRDVASAREDRSRLMNEAYAYRNQVLPRTRGEAEKNILDSRAASQEKTQRATGEAGRFLSLLREYERAPGVTESRLYLEVMESVLQGVEKFVVEPEAGEEPVDLRFFRGAPTDAIGGR